MAIAPTGRSATIIGITASGSSIVPDRTWSEIRASPVRHASPIGPSPTCTWTSVLGVHVLVGDRRRGSAIRIEHVYHERVRAHELSEHVENVAYDAAHREARVQLVGCNVEVREVVELALDLFESAGFGASLHFFELRGAGEKLLLLRLEHIDHLHEVAHRVVAHDLRPQPRVLVPEPLDLVAEVLVLVEQLFGELDALPQERCERTASRSFTRSRGTSLARPR